MTIVLVSIVMGSIHAVILRQHRFYTAQIQIAGARDAAASALGILSSELRDVSPAGDLYAAGFLHGYTRGLDVARCGQMGSIAAAEIIGHVGARPEADLRTLIRHLIP